MQNNNSTKMQMSNSGLDVEESSRYRDLSELPVVFLLSKLKNTEFLCDTSCSCIFVIIIQRWVLIKWNGYSFLNIIMLFKFQSIL